MKNQGKLFIVATPIGNIKDITLRAVEVLEQVDVIICEEYRRGSTLLKKLGIQYHELLTLNEHNEIDQLPDIIKRLLVENQSLALISDCGTPVFQDPGHTLINEAKNYGIQIIPIPGPSSITAALSIVDFELKSYVFGGFLSRNKNQRRSELFHLKSTRMPVILMDTPYRLNSLLVDVQQVFGNKQEMILACDLTLTTEDIYRGKINEIVKQLGKRKAEFVLIIPNRTPP